MKLSFAPALLSGAALLASQTSYVDAINFIVIQPDDMHFWEDWNPPAHMPWSGAYPGQTYPGSSTLPWINKLRSEGLEMTQAYTASPKCGTSRYTTVTGRYASRSSHSRQKALAQSKNPADVGIPTTKLRDVNAMADGDDCSRGNIAQVFKANNYVTGMVGKWHLTKTNNVGGTVNDTRAEVESCGFMDVEAMYPENLDGNQAWADGIHHNMEYVAYKAVEFIEDNEEKDWFLYVNPTVPHSPDVALSMEHDCRDTVDGNYTDSMEKGWSVIGMTAEFGDDCVAYRNDVKARAQIESNSNLGSIWVDDAIGAIWKALVRTNQLADTVILFQLDHGRVGKDKIWEGGVRIPQFVHYPAGLGTAARTFDGLVSTIDIGPTLLDYAGLNKDNANGWYDMDGKSWKDAVMDSAVANEWISNRCLFFESNEDRAVRCGCDKYMKLSSGSPEAAEAVNAGWQWDILTEALFDLCDSGTREYLTADSSTFSPESGVHGNILADEPEKVSDLKSLLQCHLDRTNAAIAPLYQDCTAEIATPSPTVTPKPTLPVAEIGGGPKLMDSSPWQNDIRTSSDSEVLKAIVLDDNIDRVRFNLRSPDGTRTGYTAAGAPVSTNGHESTFALFVDTTNQYGKYGYRIELTDGDGAKVEYPSSEDWIEFVVADTREELIDSARTEIADIIQSADTNLAAKFVRHSFHDCVGGCDGCVDMTNPDNAGLDIPIDALKPVVDMFTHYQVTRADIWVLAGLEGSRGAQPNGGLDNRNFSMDWYGRPNCEDINTASACVGGNCTADRGPHRELPSPSLDTHGLLNYFDVQFDFSDRDTVAIMGAHTLGTLERKNSGYNGVNGWLGNTRSLGNGYYVDLLGGSNASSPVEELMNGAGWEQVFIDNSEFTTPDRWEWERGTNPHFVMVNSDIALVRDLSAHLQADGKVDTCQFRCNRRNCPLPACPHAAATIGIAAEYKFDNGLWLEEFEVAFKKMTNKGFASAPCAETLLCKVPATARRNLRGN